MDSQLLFVVNPFSGAGKGKVIAELLEEIISTHPMLCGGNGEIFLINQTDPAILDEKLLRAEKVVAVGGDGTVHNLLPHILKCESPPALGLIPLGTSNDLARALDIPFKVDYTNRQTLRQEVDNILSAKAERIDIHCVNKDLLFCNYFSVGLDAAIVDDFDKLRGSRWAKLLPRGRWANNLMYFLIGLKNAHFRLKPPIEIEYSDQDNGSRLEIDSPCLTIIISNLSIYAGGCPIRPDARKDDGLFEITIFHSVLQFVRLIASRFLPFLRSDRGVTQIRAQEAVIRFSSTSPTQIDGEESRAVDNLRPDISVAFHAALDVLLPNRSG